METEKHSFFLLQSLFLGLEQHINYLKEFIKTNARLRLQYFRLLYIVLFQFALDQLIWIHFARFDNL